MFSGCFACGNGQLYTLLNQTNQPPHAASEILYGCPLSSVLYGQSRFQKMADFIQGFFCGQELRDVGWEDVHHSLPGVDFNGSARFFKALAVPDRVIEEHIVLTYVHSDRRQACQIPVEWRGLRVAAVAASKVKICERCERRWG
jgi:hypothetical protein